MKQINYAYSVLSDPKKRSRYDSQAGFLSGSRSLVSMLFEVIFVLALAKLLVKTFPPLLLLAIPGAVFYLFVKFPKAFAKLYVKSIKTGKE
jgi:curved DNA-binding protein CbpA